MAFLDNSGDIILDAVLTDEGRRRLAEGKGGFKITKFAFGDDEIDYGLYNPNHSSGSAYFDLEILQSPVFEAFTNNASSMKSKVITVSNPNLLYLPVIKLNERNQGVSRVGSGDGQNTFIITADKNTRDAFNSELAVGVILTAADDELDAVSNAYLKLDQGLDTTAISPTVGLSSDLREDTFIVELDNRLGSVIDLNGAEKTPSNVDDDDIATYIFSATTDTDFVAEITSTSNSGQTIAGPRGNSLQLRIAPKVDLAESNYYFDLFGVNQTSPSYSNSTGITTAKFIDSSVTIYGASTGYTVQVPIRYLKKTS